MLSLIHKRPQHPQILVQIVFIGMQVPMVVTDRSHLDSRELPHAHPELVCLFLVRHLHDDRVDVLVEARSDDFHTFVNSDVVIVLFQLGI